MAKAYLLYSQAAALAPKKTAYWLRSQAVKTRAALQSKVELPPSSSDSDVSEETEAPGPITADDLRQARQPLPPAELKADPAHKSFDLKADPRALFEQVSHAYGLDVIFDGDYPASQLAVVFRMEDADYREALHALEAATTSFVSPITDRLMLVAKDTPQKRQDVEPAVTVVIPIPQSVTVQEAQELARSVQQTMEIRRFGIDSGRRLVLLNGPISRIRPAQLLFEDLVSYRPEVAVELQFIEVTRSELLTYGLQTPTSFPVIPLTTILHNKPSIPTGLSYLLTIGGGASIFGIGVTDFNLFATSSKSNARTLLDTIVRSVDGLPATLHVGDRYPILTAGYFGPASASGAGAYRPPPSFNFEDLGLSVKVTPRIHGSEEVSLEIEAEFKVLGSGSLNGIPVISSRKLTSKVRLKDNETAVVAGMMSASEARTISGLAGLAQIPGLGALVSKRDNSRNSDEVIIVLRPHLISSTPDDIITRTIWVGTETRPRVPL